MSSLKTRLRKKKEALTISHGLFKNEDGAIDLASIMVGIIVIGLIGGVIASTVFVVIPWSQDNAAKQQLESVVSAESAYFGLSANIPPALPAGAKTNSFGDSSELAAANLLQTGPNYCAITADEGKSYTAYAQSASGVVFTVTDKDSNAAIFKGSLPDPLPADCQFLAGESDTLPDSSQTPPVDTFTNLTFTSQGGALRTLAVSADGTRMIGGGDYYAHIMLSTDSGKTWVKKLDSSVGFAFNEMDMSADGTKMIAAGYAGTDPGSVWASTNSGATWTKVKMGTTGTYGSSRYNSPKISDDGKIMTISDDYYNQTSISIDNGVTWTNTQDLRNTAISSDGKTIIGGKLTSKIYLYTSGKGAVLLPTLAGGASATVRNTSMSADGKIIVVATVGNLYYVSKDSGVTWTERTAPGTGAVYGVVVSNDGTKMLLNQSAGLYFSKDSGDTWAASKPLPKPLGNLSFSPDNSKVYGVEGSTGTWWLGTFSP